LGTVFVELSKELQENKFHMRKVLPEKKSSCT